MSGRGSTSGLQAASGGFPLYADSSGRFEPVIVTGTRLGDDDEVKLYYGDRLIQSFFANTPAGRAATGLGDSPRQPSPSAVGTSTGAAPERRGMSIDRPVAYLPGRGASARLSQMYDVNVRRDPTRSVLAQPNGDEAGDRAIRELRLRQQALLAPPIDPTIDLPLMVAGPVVQAARWLGRTALASAETVGAKFLVPKALGSVRTAALGEPGAVADLLYGARLGERLPGSIGVVIPTRPTPVELANLTEKHGVEFATTYTHGPGRNGGGGQYRLYSGTRAAVEVPVSANEMLIYHTHPGGTSFASQADMDVLELLKLAGSPQRSSQIVPVGKEVVRFGPKGWGY
jgi:hypothetical protein